MLLRQEGADGIEEPARGDRRALPRTRIDVEHGPSGPAQARAAVSARAEQLGLGETCDDVVLLASEMVTNAVRHAAPPVRLEIAAGNDDVVVAVTDGSSGLPAPRPADPEAEGGRGMLLVDLLSADHGVRIDPPGKAVWARVRRRARS
jgi:anti-sigma regulatory factor (Ser/Thr protein kinase)